MSFLQSVTGHSLDLLLVGLGLAVVLRLLGLVAEGVLGGGGADKMLVICPRTMPR